MNSVGNVKSSKLKSAMSSRQCQVFEINLAMSSLRDSSHSVCAEVAL
jgi:hypothetical protein